MKKLLLLLLVAAALAGVTRVVHRVWLHFARQHVVQVPVLMYHRIGSEGGDAWWVPTATFEEQMRFLSESGYTSVLPSDLVAKRKRGRRLPTKPVVITFDDGHLNSLTAAEPILRKYGFRAVNFLITDRVAERAEDRMAFEDIPCLVWPEVREMQARGTFFFGSHSASHANLAALGDNARGELQKSWDALVQHGVSAPEGFCYPYGEYKDVTLEAMRRSPFKIAFVVADAIAQIGGTNSLMTVPRVSVSGGPRALSVTDVRRDTAAGTVEVIVEFQGRPLRGCPRLVWSGLGPDEGWQPQGRLQVGTNTFDWAASSRPHFEGPLTFEWWDNNHVLLLYRSALSTSAGR